MVEVKPDSDATHSLLERIEAGESGAIDGLLARHRPWLQYLVQFRLDGRLRSRVDASDVVQETQLDAFRRLPEFLERRPMPFRLWLRKTFEERMRMIERQHLEALRRATGREVPLRDGSAAPVTALVAGTDPSPSEQFAQFELARRMRDLLGQLEDMDREILLMRTFEGLSYAEVACILEIDSATARKRHGRALVRLHKLLTDRNITESQL